MKETAVQAAFASLDIEAAGIARISEYFDRETLEQAVQMLCSAGQIATAGCGGSGIVARKFAHSLCCIEQNAHFLDPSEALHGGLGCLKAGDVLLLISRGGKTSELLPMIDTAKRKQVKIISFTEQTESVMAKQSDLVVRMQIPRESDPLNVMTTTSFLVPCAIFDAILAALIEETGYGLQQFAGIHPGGAVGAQLNAKTK